MKALHATRTTRHAPSLGSPRPRQSIRSVGSGQSVRSRHFNRAPASPPSVLWVLLVLFVLSLTPAQTATADDTGRIEGTVRIGAKPAAGVEVILLSYEPGDDRAPHELNTIKTDGEGRYTFDNVEPGEWRAGIFKNYITRNQGWSCPTGTPSHEVAFPVKPGETAHVDIGGTGRPVIGKMVPSKNCTVRIAYQGGDFRRVYTKRVPIPYPEGMDDIQRRAWSSAWTKTEEGKAWRRLRRSYVVDVEKDGTFRVEDVPPGEYGLRIDVGEWGVRDPRPGGEAYCSFTVPEIPGGRTDEPLDLGEVEVKMKGEPEAETNQIRYPGAEAEKIMGGFAFTEGPACDADGNVFFTDQPNDRILRWSADGELSTWLQPCGRSNGLCFDEEGNLWACADKRNQLWRIGRDRNTGLKVLTTLVKDYQGKLLNGPNDIWIRPDGGAYFTDPFYKRDYWNRGPIEQECQGVYYLSPDHKTLTRVADDLEQPNGIIGTPDGNTLYVTDIRAKKTYSYTIHEDGSLTDKTLFCEMGSDGMTIDDKGNVYLTGKGVFVFDKTGAQIDHIEIDEPWTANVCFGGRDRQSLFITASKGLYRLRTRVKGVGSQ